MYYFTGTKSATAVSLNLPAGNYAYTWFDTRAWDASGLKSGQVSGGSPTSIPAPATKGWDAATGVVLVVYKQPSPPASPAAPSSLTATAVSSRQINLAWVDNSVDEDGFKIERCTGSGCSNFTLIATVVPDVTQFADKGIRKKTAYTYRVKAYNVGGDSAPSNTFVVSLTMKE